MFNNIKNIFNILDLRKKIFFTLGVILIYRLGCHIPTPGINSQALTNFFNQARGTLFGMFDMFSGGALKRASIFALGVMPYINASIIMQLLTAVVPSLERLSKEGADGHKKINQYSHYLTIFLCIVQSLFMAIGLEKMSAGSGGMVFVKYPGFFFRLITIVTFTAGTMIIVWLGEQITERGIGNGVSLIILSGIIAEIPMDFWKTAALVRSGEMKLFTVIFLLLIIVLLIALVVYVEQGYRKIPIQYARRVIGQKNYGGQSTHLPLKVDQSGVIAVIFASSIIIIPGTLAQFAKNPFINRIAEYLRPDGPLYVILYAPLIIFFCFFYTAISFNPVDIAENLKKSGGFIPGIRPGNSTAEYIEDIISKITLVGAVFVAFIAIMPIFLGRFFNIPFYFGGTSLLILVGVSIDTMKQIESHLLMRHYDGFMKKDKSSNTGD
ncbi:preprotein translocase subunit SecY [Candidatus Desantisbacteria bacterium]|nr:preprotein translocase subunit SecY [Candidatus Desantisbacteria bacterium]